MWDSERLFLLVEPMAVSLYRWQKRHLVRLADFAPDAGGLADFAKWRRDKARLPIAVVSDLPDEGFVLEAIPRLHGAERRALVQRKIQRHFPDTPYVTVRTLPWQTQERRKEENLLLSSLPLLPLAEWLVAAKPLSGLYALAQLIEAAGKKLALPEDVIVLTRRGSFVRQTLLRAHVPCFSRLISGNGENLREESRRLLTYLARQQPLPTDLPLCPLCALADAERELLGTEFTLIPSIEADDAFFLSLLADQPPKTQYAPEALRHRPPGMKRLVVVTGALCLVAGAALGAYAYREADQLRRQTAGVLEELKSKETPGQVEREFDMERASQLLMHAPQQMPETLFADLQSLSRLLDGFPGLRLENLSWEAAGQRMILEIRHDAAAENAVAAFRRAARMRGYESGEASEVNGSIRLTLSKGER